jgi:hypothetical protein
MFKGIEAFDVEIERRASRPEVDFMKANHFQGLPPSTTLNELPAIRRN